MSTFVATHAGDRDRDVRRDAIAVPPADAEAAVAFAARDVVVGALADEDA